MFSPGPRRQAEEMCRLLRKGPFSVGEEQSHTGKFFVLTNIESRDYCFTVCHEVQFLDLFQVPGSDPVSVRIQYNLFYLRMFGIIEKAHFKFI